MDTTKANTFEADASRASELYGQTQGAMVLIGAGLGWIISGLAALGDMPLSLFLAVLAAAALLLLGGLAIRRSAPGLPDASWTPQVSRVFFQAFAGEIAGIVTIAVGALLLHQTVWIPPLIALAVGLHFFPLAHVSRRPLYYLTGAALCLICAMTIAFVPPHFGPRHLQGWLLVAGLSSGTVLWSTSLWMLLQSAVGLRKFSQSRHLAK